jgi:uncharacterized membrane protein
MTQTPSDVPSSAQPSPTGPAGAKSTGLDPKLSGLLCYFLWGVTGILFLVLEHDPRVRFHAAQSIVVTIVLIVLSVVLTVLSTILGAVPVLGWIVSFLAGIAWMFFVFGLWLFLMYKGYQLEKYKLPFVGGYAEQLAAKQF